MAKQRSGLHKEISSIFGGVPLPGKNGREQVRDDSSTNHTAGHIPPRPPSPPPNPVLAGTQQPAQRPQQQQPVNEAPKQPVVSPVVSDNAKTSFVTETLGKFAQKIKDRLLTPEPGVSRSRQAAMLITIPILFLGMVFVFGRLLIGSGSAKAQSRGSDATLHGSKVSTEIDWEKPLPYPADLRDPMSKVAGQSSQTVLDAPVVTGIVYSEQKPMVLVGTKIVYEGQTILGATVLKINEDSVEFERDGERWTQRVAK